MSNPRIPSLAKLVSESNPQRAEAIAKDPERAKALEEIEGLLEAGILSAPHANGEVKAEDLKPKKKGRPRKEEGGEPKEKGEKEPSKAQKAVALALREGAEVFLDRDGRTCLDTPENEEQGRRTFRGKAARPWLSGLLHRHTGTALTRSQAEEAEAIFEAIAYNKGETRETFVRLAHHEGEIFLDLGNKAGEVVRIHPGGWEIVTRPPVRFLRPSSMDPLPTPTKGSETGWEDFRSIMHKPGEEDFVLMVSWLLGAFCGGPYPILALASEQGTGKTTQGKLLRRLLDPNKADLRSAPGGEKDLLIQAENSLICGFDNLSSIPVWLSDALCRLVTGGGYSSRELYTDAGEVILSARRPVILTSIGTVTDRPDLAERTLPVRLPVIPDAARTTEAIVWERVERVAPNILGAILDAVAEGLKRRRDFDTVQVSRMADFARWIMACEPALPWEPGRFVEVYTGALDQIVSQGIETNPFASALLSFLEARPGHRWEGDSEELRTTLSTFAGIGSEAPRGWPKSARDLRAHLDRVMPLLRRARGIELEREWHGENRRRTLVFSIPEGISGP
jgi:hypothetical protein